MTKEIKRPSARHQEDPFLGYESLQASLDDCEYSSQAEVLARMLNRENIFVSGSAGAGKTHVIKHFIDLIKDETDGEVEIAMTASTGIAATLIGGKTIHSWAGLGISEAPFNPKKIEKMMYSRRYDMVSADVLIIDEISMLPRKLLDKLDAVLKFFRRNKKPFGGLQVIFVGDFLQLPPVVKNGEDLGSSYCYHADAWKEANITHCYLDKARRSTDPKLRKVLGDIMNGHISKETIKHIKDRMEAQRDMSKVYATLFTVNRDVDSYNKMRLDSNTGEPVHIGVTGEVNRTKNKKKLEAFKKRCGIEDVVTLKVGAQVILTKNMKTGNDEQLANGMLGVVEFFEGRGRNKIPVVRFNCGIVAPIDRFKYEETKRETYTDVNGEEKSEDFVILSASQIPLKLGYGITVHKSQGQTFDGVVTDLSNSFQSGLGYVALSRVKKLDDLIINGFSKKALYLNPQSKLISNEVVALAKETRQATVENIDSYSLLLTERKARDMLWAEKLGVGGYYS